MLARAPAHDVDEPRRDLGAVEDDQRLLGVRLSHWTGSPARRRSRCCKRSARSKARATRRWSVSAIAALKAVSYSVTSRKNSDSSDSLDSGVADRCITSIEPASLAARARGALTPRPTS